MLVFLMRHGQAVDARLASEPERWLTADGREECRRASATLLAKGYALTHVYASPLARAVQSAELLAAGLGFAGPVIVRPELVPSGDGARAVQLLDAHAGGDVVALVTHEPIVRAIASELSGGPFPSFTTAGVAIIEVPGGALVDRI